jgi:hypothetical protein
VGGQKEKRKRSGRLRKEKKKEEGEQDEWTEEAFFLRRLSVSLSLSSFIAYRLGTRGVSLAHGCCCYNEERRELEETGVERE